ncbi:DUF3027 domain-containing protein [Vallicoccus soli]|uniref:DUF3027 domain-containing protein n=1 Tax=Vallicoccus soli TaxID=2339232 RepID=UPI001C49B54D|nr:DUF3027 domain-containing protein [Vallicoccus soli]
MLDQQCADAVDLARAAAEELAAPDPVGEHLGVVAEGDRIVTHRFACTSRAYVGWYWAVTVARASRSRVVTVDEAVLLPGEGAVRAPEWLPWSERLRPGDLGVGDLLPTAADDPRLVPGWGEALAPGLEEAGEDDALDRALGWQLGLGRARVLSQVGRDDAADRWYAGDRGPDAPIAKAAPGQCSTCGFLVPLTGVLRRAFGVCANEYSPADGGVVAVDHGCGAHSEAEVLPPAPAAAPVVDELGYDEVDARPAPHEPGSVDDASPGEDLGHS